MSIGSLSSFGGSFLSHFGVSSSQYDWELESGLRILNVKMLATLENRETLIANPQYARQLAMGLRILAEYSLLTPENREALAANAQHAEELADGFRILKAAGLLQPENRAALIANAERAKNLAKGFEMLNQSGLLEENRDSLVANKELTSLLIDIWDFLQKVDLDTQESFGALIENRPLLKQFDIGFEILYQNDLLTPQNVALLLSGGGLFIQRLTAQVAMGDTLDQARFDAIMNVVFVAVPVPSVA